MDIDLSRPHLANSVVLLPKRWRVEQAVDAGRFHRCLIVDCEMLTHVAESMILLGSTMRLIFALTV